jgi:5-methyltetrahydropteroyltriglutamate--homocysteine methyltransferase
MVDRLMETAPDAGFEERIEEAVADVVRHQAAVGIDILNDGEQGKAGYAIYVKDRLTGFDGPPEWVGSRRPEMDDHPDFGERWRAAQDGKALLTPSCASEIRVKDPDAAGHDVARLKVAAAAAGVPDDRLFMSAASPGVISHFFANHHYPSREAYLGALADAMRHEYEAIAGAGIMLQIDCPDLAMSRHSVFADASVEEFRRAAALSVEALNSAVRNIPPERMRMHVCWGNYDGPHNHDIELKDVVDVVLTARPDGLLLESSNPRHGHEWRVWEDVELPDGKYLVPGVIDSTNNYVEHPELVAQRLRNFARVVGPERVMGGSDCGFGTVARLSLVAPSIVWSKLRSLVEGAERASRDFGS